MNPNLPQAERIIRLLDSLFYITQRSRAMRRAFLAAIIVLSSVDLYTQTLPVPQVITDPKQISSKPNA